MGVERNVNSQDFIRLDMMKTRMGVGVKDNRQRTQAIREGIEQLWLQFSLENQMKVSMDDKKVENMRQKLAALRTD